ncbi:DUF411 domain-containing protein [Azospirillum sp. sgz302134]
MRLSRRSVLRSAIALSGIGLIAPITRSAAASPASEVRVYRDASCTCCGAWVKRMEAEGFSLTVVNISDLQRKKKELAIPKTLWSCHTATVGDFVLEGHVPPSSVKRLLAERPPARGIAVAGMPIGSPGMELGDYKEPFPVMIFEGDAVPAVWEWH